MKVLVISAAIVFGFVGGAASDPAPAEPIKLSDVVAVAVRQSPDLASARIDLAAAGAELQTLRGIEDFHLGASASYVRDTDQPTSVLVGNQRFSRITGSVSLNKLLATGTQVALTTGTQFTSEAAALGGIVTEGYASNATLSVTQPLLRGRGAAQVEGAIRAARHQRDAASLRQTARARDTVVSITVAYWQVALAWRELDVRKHSLMLAQKQLDFTEGAIRSDKVPKSEALAVQEVLAIRQQDVLAAEQLVVDQSLSLRQLAGLEVGPDALELRTEELPVVRPVTFDLAEVVAHTFDQSAELAALAASSRAAVADVEAAEGAARSRLDLALSAGAQSADMTFRESVNKAVALKGYSVAASLTFDHAIEGNAEHGGQAAAHAVLLRAQVDTRAARARLAAVSTQAVRRARAALATIALGDRTIGLAEQNVAAEQHRFELAKSTNFDVLRRQDELEQAQLRHAAAVVDYLSARARLEGLTGEILAHYGVVMP